MSSGSECKEFFFEEFVVGHFEHHTPCSPGQYRYMPFRGLAHFRLVQALTSSGSQRCYYVVEGEKRYFTVVTLPSYGILQVA